RCDDGVIAMGDQLADQSGPEICYIPKGVGRKEYYWAIPRHALSTALAQRPDTALLPIIGQRSLAATLPIFVLAATASKEIQIIHEPPQHFELFGVKC
ncbi:MAG: hypothetical protein ACJ8E6_04010, partial [Sphingomicrobium sp.]